MKKRIEWGCLPNQMKYITLLMGVVLALCLGWLFHNWVVTVVGIGITIAIFCSLFIHFAYFGEKWFIFAYGLIWIFKKADSVSLRPGVDADGFKCTHYFVGDGKALYLYTKDASQKIKCNNYKKIFEGLKTNSIIAIKTDRKSFNKIGGLPYLPKDFEWPTYKNPQETEPVIFESKERMLNFIFQIDFADVSKYDSQDLLPKSGVLSIFYDSITQPWNDDGSHKAVRVYYFEDKNSLRQITKSPVPLDECNGIITEKFFDFSTREEIPDEDDAELLLNKKLPKYYDAKEDSEYKVDNMPAETKLLGYAQTIQGATLYCCNTAEIEQFDYDEYVLLCQLCSSYEDENSLNFGDDGHLYIYIKKSDLKMKIFNNIYFCVDCY